MKKILIVEDEAVLRDVYKTLFTLKKFDVYEAIHGKDALEKLSAHHPDVVLLDIMMPIMDGLEFLKKASIDKKYPTTKVIVLSNLSDPKTIGRITQLGADKYVLKSSVSPGELLAAVGEVLHA